MNTANTINKSNVTQPPINTRAAWRPVLKPVASLFIGALLCLGSSHAWSQSQGNADAVGVKLSQVRDLAGKVKAAQGPSHAQLAVQLREGLRDAKAGVGRVKDELTAARVALQAKGLPAEILARHDQMVAQLEQRAAQFDRASQAWQAGDTPDSVAGLTQFFDQYPDVKRAPVDLGSLPWGHPKASPRMPAETKTAWFRNLYNDQKIRLAQAGSLTTIGGVRFAIPPDPTQAPQDADLAATPEVQLTPAVRAKAAELGNNPVRITNWVRNNIQWVPTWGSVQGADLTLKTLRGNAVDTASLHIALLRAAGIPARYQFGTIELPTAALANWAGGVQRPEAALNLLAQGGIAARGVSSAGQITSIRMEHVWAVAYVNWLPSRGARDGGANLTPPQHPSPNAQLNAWVPLDASFRQYQYDAGLNLAELSPFNAQALLDATRQGATCTAATAARLNLPALMANYAQFQTQAQAQLAALGPDATVGQVLGRTAPLRHEPPLLAGSLPYPTIVTATPVAALPSALGWTVQVSLMDGLNQVLSFSHAWSDLDGQALLLSFVPATAADAQTLATLLRPGTGGDAVTGLPAGIAAYLVKLKAQLRLNGQVVAEGGSYTLGQGLVLRTAIQSADGAAPVSTDALISVGETHAALAQSQAQGAGAPQAISTQLAALRAQLGTTGLPGGPDQAAQTLAGLAGAWHASVDAKSRLRQPVADMVELRLPGIARASTRLETTSVFGLITQVRASGVGLHVDRYQSASAPRGQQSDAAAQGYAQQGLERASVTAHQLLDRIFGPAGGNAQSALSGLALAAGQGQTILRADTTTLAQVLPLMDPASPLQAQLQQAVAGGQQALLASAVVDLGGLPMDPLVLSDPASGAAAYLVTSRNAPVVQLTAQRPGLAGWLGLADAQASAALVGPALDALVGQLNAAQSVLGDIATVRWQGFAGQAEVIDSLYLSRVASYAGTANACDWLTSSLSSQLGAGLPSAQHVNHPPVILSQPVTTAAPGVAYSYQVAASDPDGDPLSFSLLGAPTGMGIDARGLVTWPRPTAGQFNLTVRVSDGQAFTDQSYVLSVGAAAGLQLGASLSPTIAAAGQTITLVVNAASSAGAVTRSATLDGAALALDAQGVASFAAPASGAHRVLVTASDGQTSATREIILTVRDASLTAAPAAVITSPQEDSSLRGVAAITGTASSPGFAYYRLVLRRMGEPDTAWQEIGRGLQPVANGTLGQLDTSRWDDGLWQIGLVVVDVNGVQTNAAVTVEFLGNLKLGQFRLSFADVHAQALGLPLLLTRTYDSTKKNQAGDFGWGWFASGQDISVRKNMTLGLAWEVTQQQLQLCLRPVGVRRIIISLPDGALYRFSAQNAQECAFAAVPAVDVQFIPVPGPTGGSVAGRVSAGAQLRAIDGALVQAQGGMLVDDLGQPWNPKDFELTTEEGFKYQLREGVGVLNVTDPYGNRLTYGAGGYQHSANLGLSFSRDAQGRITSATDPAGKSISYTYNAAGELETVTDRAGGVTRFTYATVAGASTSATSGNQDAQHLLASITDPRGQVVLSNQFDAYGRLIASADALGQAAQQSFDTVANQQTVTDRRGNKSVYTFDADGNISQVVNALGQTSKFTFDANSNETSTTNALGQTTTRTFDPVTGKQLSESNPLGLTTSTAYAGVGAAWQRMNPLSSTDARGNATGYSYDNPMQPGASPTAINEPLGRSTYLGLDLKGNLRGLNIAGESYTYGYDSQGRKTSETNGLGQSTTYSYDTNGNELTRTVTKSVNGQTVTFTTSKTYDADNRLLQETDALGGKRTSTYNAAGKLATQTDSFGRVTTYTYDANARLTATTYPDGTSEQTSYDAEGNETSKTDRAGRITRMDYDALNRLVKTTYPDGTFESTTYDAAGRVVATVDRRGATSTMEYDAAGRQTASVDATGRRTSQTYDANGNRTSVTVDGRTTSYAYDALNRLTSTTWADGSTATTVYRTDNRKQSETDARGVTTTYGYDAAGRLTSVAQSASATSTATTTYGYDETAAKVKQVDALGRTTSWTIDGNGRITSRTIQDGSQESSSYDSEGNRLGRKTFAGEQLSFQYDSANRLTGQSVSQGAGGNSAIGQAVISYSYSPSGQLLQQAEQGATSLSGSQSYQYDANDRLTRLSNPLGQIGWALDANGNITQRSYVGAVGASAGTVASQYDAAGRLVTVTAGDGKQARYTYDQAGRLIATERDLNPAAGQSQVLVTYQRYDSADRLVAIAQVKRVGASETVLAGQALTRSASGAIARIDTYRGGTYDPTSGLFSGTPATSQAFQYDSNARLTRETRSSVQGTATVSIDTAYEYDAAGNRTKKTVSTAAGANITAYTYDQADRLTLESTSLGAGGTNTVTYGWDGNGNLASKTEAGKVTLYRFDPQNRLIDIRTGAALADASAAAPTVSYAYDAGGNRVKKTTAQGGTRYLIDPSHQYSQVALEATGSQSTAYVRGAQLIRQTKVGGASSEDIFPLHGHLGTSLGAIDANGNLVEQTDADAFGNLGQPIGARQTHLYAGEYWDQDAQLLYLRARWYDPKIGRLISADPFEGKQSDPRSLNRYSYAHSDPGSNLDRSGRTNMEELSIASSEMAGGAAGGISLAALTGSIASANSLYVASAGVPFMAVQGPRVVQYLQGSAAAGFRALQSSAYLVARGQAVTAQQLQAARNLGTAYTQSLNQIMRANASSFGLEIHKLLVS